MLFLFSAMLIVSAVSSRPLATEEQPKIRITDVVDKSVREEETALSPADFAAAPQKEVDLKTIGIETKIDPTMGNKTEGDIAIADIKGFVDANNKLGRNAIRQTYRRWPNGEIPYTMSSQYGAYARSVIAKAMQEYHDKTCVRFVARDANRHKDYVYIHPDDGCYSLVGRTGGRQPLSLDSGCIQTGTIVHELMHAVGFFHEQSRADRDQFIEIIWQNVLRGANDQFEKYGLNVLDHLNEPYDYASIMHYGPYAFSDNGRKTIIARQTGSDKMGQRVAFSDIDLRKINRLYGCPQGRNIVGNSINDAVQQPPQPEVEQAECKDSNWRCPFWSMSIFGYCEKYAEIAHVTCPLSCGNCPSATAVRTTTAPPITTPPFPFTNPQTTGCLDRNKSCPMWASRGHCSREYTAGMMRSLCAASCGICTPTVLPQPDEEEEGRCEDTDSSFTCRMAAIFGECDEHSDTCARTCNFC